MRLVALALALLAALPAAADEPKKDPSELKVETRHEVTVDGVAFAYSATAGTVILRGDDDKPRASLFYVSYIREGTDPATRPITFAFNGGPGSSAVWLHLGALGPRRVALGDEGEALPPPGRLEDNPATWLDMTDLVFIDPVSTGFSRATEGQDPKQFHGLDEDVRAVGDLVRILVTRLRRWGSPKALVGESYGTTRAAHLARHLQDGLGMQLSAVVLISAVLDFQTIRFDQGNDMPYWLYVPSYTASAFHHKKLEAPLQESLVKTLAEVEVWTRQTYLPALAAGDALPAAERAAVAKSLARYTGLPVEVCERADLRISQGLFCKELLRDQGKSVGRFDARYVGTDRLKLGSSPDYDPSYAAVQGPYTSGINDYLRRELGFESDMTYEVLTGRVHPWNLGAQNRYATVVESLRDAVVENKGLHVLFCGGYTDLATPYFAMDHTIAHMGLAPEDKARVHRATYAAGHMMYLRKADLLKLKADAAAVYQAATKR